jgi:putative endonuclease
VRAAGAHERDHLRGLDDAHCRFDVVEADGAADAPRLHWIRDAFRAGE